MMDKQIFANGNSLKLISHNPFILEIYVNNHSLLGAENTVQLHHCAFEITYNGKPIPVGNGSLTPGSVDGSWESKFSKHLIRLCVTEHPVHPVPCLTLELIGHESAPDSQGVLEWTVKIDGCFCPIPTEYDVTLGSRKYLPLYMTKVPEHRSTTCRYRFEFKDRQFRCSFPLFFWIDNLTMLEYSGVAFVVEMSHAQERGFLALPVRIGEESPATDSCLVLNRLYTPFLLTTGGQLSCGQLSCLAALPVKHVFTLSSYDSWENVTDVCRHDVPPGCRRTVEIQAFVDEALLGQQITRPVSQLIVLPRKDQTNVFMQYYASIMPVRVICSADWQPGEILEIIREQGIRDVVVAESTQLVRFLKDQVDTASISHVLDAHSLLESYPPFFGYQYAFHRKRLLLELGVNIAEQLPAPLIGPEVGTLVSLDEDAMPSALPALAFARSKHSVVFPVSDSTQSPDVEELVEDFVRISGDLQRIRDEQQIWETYRDLVTDDPEANERARTFLRVVEMLTPIEERTQDGPLTKSVAEELAERSRQRYKRTTRSLHTVKNHPEFAGREVDVLLQVCILESGEVLRRCINENYLRFISNAISHLLVFRGRRALPWEFVNLSETQEVATILGQHIPCGSFLTDDPIVLSQTLACVQCFQQPFFERSSIVSIVGDPLGNLPGSEFEANLIRMTLESLKSCKVHTFVGEQVNFNTIRDAVAESIIFHYTGHHIAAYGKGLTLGNGQFFRGEDIEDVRPSVIVFLNGCSTGNPNSNEPTGFADVLLEKQASAVVLTYWDITDIHISDMLEHPNLMADVVNVFTAGSAILAGPRRRPTTLVSSQFYGELLGFRTVGEALCSAKRLAWNKIHHKNLSPISYLGFGDPTFRPLGNGGYSTLGRHFQDLADRYSGTEDELVLRSASATFYEAGVRQLEVVRNDIPIKAEVVERKLSLLRGLGKYNLAAVEGRKAIGLPLSVDRLEGLRKSASLFAEAEAVHSQDDWAAKQYWMEGLAHTCEGQLRLRDGDKEQEAYKCFLKACECQFAAMRLEDNPHAKLKRFQELHKAWTMVEQCIQRQPNLVRDTEGEARIRTYYEHTFRMNPRFFRSR